MRVLKRAPRCGCERTMVTCPSLGPGPFPRVRVPLCSQLFPGTQLPRPPPLPSWKAGGSDSVRGAEPRAAVPRPGLAHRPQLGFQGYVLPGRL